MAQHPARQPELDAVIEQYDGDPGALLQILIALQERQGWIRPETMRYLSARLGLPYARIEGVVGFYSFLYDKPMGEYRLLFSDNVTDRMLGSQELFEYTCRKLWVEPGRPSDDGLVSVHTTSCTGLCDQGPALLVNGRAIGRLSRERLDVICDLILARQPLSAWPAELFEVRSLVRRSERLLAQPLAPGQAIRATVERGAEATLAEIKAANLRGRGGAGFPTGLKWAACREAPGEARYVVCNADEGEPGTFKDRVLLAEHADQVFEGMTVAAFILGACQGFLYLRGEYRFLLEPLKACLARRRAAGLLGRGIAGVPGFDFDIAIHLGAGAYVCGEESALIESLEGKRGIPRNRPPFPVTHGYLQQPTVVNNVETFCAAAHIALSGAAHWRALGTEASTGTKLLSVSGDCARPGVYEYPFGVTVRQVLADCGAAPDALAVQVGGPSGTLIGADEFDRRIAFEDLACAGAVMVFGPQRDIFEVVRNFAHFFAHESCGFCTPCRVGTAMLRQTLDKIAQGHGTQHELNEIYSLNRVLQASAHCGLGHSACNPMLDLLKRFRPAIERRLKSLDFEPAFDLDGALAAARRMTGRNDAGAHLHSEPTP